ncbi:thymidine phosphorylase [Sinorhizobium americanum]|uniref:Thymidine phosphorylase n=1 Tax=Sinorhizobium americanum TaxID=194963 RepID=A0A4R2BEP2_9HYPH|nr:thymidine phosphorylase [Sinorhizobium americanum]APG82915.1 thymidine phosphorylase DeoA [Sinorhizobium americanum CCGM7]TCN24722.1 thymidine phosphorylase [Sinorhizobium americanum]
MAPLPQEVIRKKRDGGRLEPAEIRGFIEGVTDGSVSEGQVAAFAMATWFSGMSRDECVALTLAMRDSGETLDWSGFGRPIADKHSTGGVGDNVSLMLAPIIAACGAAVPMISGRGLGHTGGTLDKLESIPGYDIQPPPELFRQIVEEVGCAIIGQTANLAPADKRLYAIRDVTATVDSVPLITASILSKKLAAGLQSLVLDVKVGNGSFMTDASETEILARSLVDVANGAGVRTSALITDMNEPLADAAGNALEVENCLAYLRGEKAGTRLDQVVIAFAAEMLVAARMSAHRAEGEAMARRALESGDAMERFALMVHRLGGPADFVDRPEAHLEKAPAIIPVPANRGGYLAACETRELGMAVIALGGGRMRPDDRIDHRIGLAGLKPLGTKVERGEPIAFVHAADRQQAEAVRDGVAGLYVIADEPPAPRPVIISRII